MMVGRGTRENKDALLLGLSRENINRLMKGQPILLTSETHGEAVPEGWAIVILFGETEQSLVNDMRDFIGPKTKVHIDERFRETEVHAKKP